VPPVAKSQNVMDVYEISDYIIIATGPSPGSFQAFTVGYRRAKNSGPGAWAWPPSVAFSTLAESRARGTTGAAGMAIVAGVSCGEFFLA
jgi:hypothetical protein